MGKAWQARTNGFKYGFFGCCLCGHFRLSFDFSRMDSLGVLYETHGFTCGLYWTFGASVLEEFELRTEQFVYVRVVDSSSRMLMKLVKSSGWVPSYTASTRL